MYTEAVPGNVFTTASMSAPMRSITARSGPATLMPTGVLMPVASMSVRVLMGIVQVLARPGMRTTRSSSERSPSMVIPSRHSPRGLSWIIVSIIVKGAGSVAVSARPTLPKTLATSGTVRISRSVCCSSSRALSMEMPGWVLGMYMRSPSFRGGMNSVPRRSAGHALANVRAAAPTSTAQGCLSTASMRGRYAACSARSTGLACALMRPRKQKPISTGTSVTARPAAAAIA